MSVVLLVKTLLKWLGYSLLPCAPTDSSTKFIVGHYGVLSWGKDLFLEVAITFDSFKSILDNQ